MSDNPKLAALLTSLHLVLERIRILIDGKLDSDGVAVSASKLENARTISVTGDGTGSTTFDGSANRSIAFALAATGVSAGNYGSATSSLRLTVDGKGRAVSVEAVELQRGTTAVVGLVQLSSAVNSTSQTLAATPSAVKQAYDLAAAALPAAQKGVANGVATLDANGQVPASQLPSFVDDVLEFPNLQSFPVTGESGKLYVDIAANEVYRWSGTTYIWVSASVGAADTAVRLATIRTINGVGFDGTANIVLPTVNNSGNQTIAGIKTFTSPIVADVTGKSAEAAKLTYSRTVAISGDVVGNGDFDGTSNLTIPVVLGASGVNAGLYGAEDQIPVLTVDAKGRITNADFVPMALASSSKAGLVRLSSAVNSSSTTMAATPAAVKIAYDLANGAIRATEKGAPNGLATLDSAGLIPPSQLPSYVDDVLEFADLSAFPAEGESGKIYVAVDTNRTYRWSGTVYIHIGADASSADVALALATARTITITGDASWSIVFDGSVNRTGVLTLANTGAVAGTYGDANNIPRLTVDAKGRVTGVTTIPRPTTTEEAERLVTARTIAITGDGTANGLFDGSAGLSLALALANTGVVAGSYGKVTVDAKGRVTAGGALLEADIPALAIAKTTGLQAALDAKFSISNLSSSVSSTSNATAATSGAVKQAYDLAAAALPASQKGAVNGVASLGADGKVPAAQLPSYVDDVLEFANLGSFPGTGEQGKIYVSIDNGNMYRWSGSVYIQIGGSTGAAESALKLTTARSIAATGDATWTVNFDGSANASGVLTLSNSGVTAGTYGKVTVDAKGRVTAGAALVPGDIPTLNQSTTGNAATATRLATTRALTIGATAKNFDGSAAVSWTLAEMGAAAEGHTHSYLPLSGGTVTGVTIFSNATASTSATTGALRVVGGVGVGGDIYASGDVSAYSDIRLKTDIRIIDEALERVLQLRGVTYLRKDTGKIQTGLIAQEVQAVLPEAVSGEETLAVAYGNLAGLFVEAIKELSGKIDELRAEVDELRGK